MRLKVCAGAIAGSLAASMAQALVDFVWYVPACMAIMAILAACAFRVSQFAAGETTTAQPARLWRLAPVACTILLLPLGAWMIHNRLGPAIAEPYWEQYLIALKAENAESRPVDNTDPEVNRNAIDAAVQRENKLIDCLEKAVYWQPAHASAQLALAEAHLRLFEKLQAGSPNPMTLVNIRDAAIDSNFSSREALCAWLAQAFGDHWVHLDVALQHVKQPCLYVRCKVEVTSTLQNYHFLDGKNRLPKQACIAQALRVRPFDGVVVLHRRRRSLFGRQRHSNGWIFPSKHFAAAATISNN